MKLLDDNLKLYSISNAAKNLSIRKETLNKLISEGKIGVIVLGKRKKISHLELVQYIQSNTVKTNIKDNTTERNIESIVKVHKYSSKRNSLDEINEIINKMRGKK